MVEAGAGATAEAVVRGLFCHLLVQIIFIVVTIESVCYFCHNQTFMIQTDDSGLKCLLANMQSSVVQ